MPNRCTFPNNPERHGSVRPCVVSCRHEYAVKLPPVVDDVTVPLIAFVVLILAVAALALHQWWIYAVLAVDFILGRRCGPRASPGV